MADWLLKDGEQSPEIPGDGDQEFEPTAEMLVHDFDDEQTLAEEEAIASAGGEDPQNELNNLQKESDMPIEQLLALYGYGDRGSGAAGGNGEVAVPTDARLPEEELEEDMEEDEEEDEEEEEDDDDDDDDESLESESSSSRNAISSKKDLPAVSVLAESSLESDNESGEENILEFKNEFMKDTNNKSKKPNTFQESEDESGSLKSDIHEEDSNESELNKSEDDEEADFEEGEGEEKGEEEGDIGSVDDSIHLQNSIKNRRVMNSSSSSSSDNESGEDNILEFKNKFMKETNNKSKKPNTFQESEDESGSLKSDIHEEDSNESELNKSEDDEEGEGEEEEEEEVDIGSVDDSNHLQNSIKNRRVMNSSKIDRNCIAEAVLPSQEPLLDFSAGYVLPDEISLPSINLEEIGNIDIPLSILDAERLKAFLDRQRDGGASPTLFPSSRKHTFEKCSDRMILSTLENFDISSLVIKMLGLPVSKTMDFEAKFDKLMLFEVDGQYTHTSDSGKDFGTFGTAILQLPVNGGHDGGNFHVEYKGRKATYEDQVDSHKLSSLSSFYDSCQYVMKPITRGWKLTLVFNLVWTNSTIVMPTDFLVFLKSLKKLEEALISWVPQRNEDVFSTEVQQLLKENVKIPLITWIDDKIVSCNEKAEDTDIEDSEDSENSENDDNSEYEYDSDSSDLWYDDETDCHCDQKISTRECEEEDVLFFVLEEKYFENSLMFHHLQGNDRILADLLRCCPFIDVHLAKATYIKPIARKTTGGMAPKNQSPIKILRWIDSNGAVKDLKIDELNWSEKCVGPIRNLLGPCSTETYSETRLNSAECHYQNSFRCSGEVEIIRERICFHTILVIWPKHQSIGMYCRYGRYGLDMFLNYFESSLTSMLGWQAVAQQQLTQDFHQVVEYCCTHPKRIWTQSSFKKGEITLRLLRLCIALRARKEGLQILKILGSEFETKRKKQILSFVGIQNEQVAQALVQFVCQSNGLDDCIDLIKRLITTHRIFKQFVPITKMIQYFLDAKCVEGAVLVGDGVASSLNNFDQKRVAVLKKPDVSLYVDAIVSLEAYPEASSQERLASLVSLFSKLGSSLRCRLVVQLDAQVNSRCIVSQSCQFIFLEICETFLSSELRVPSAADALGLLKCFILQENPKWLESLLSNMIPDQFERIVLFTKLLSHQSLWKLATSSELGKKSLVFILNRYSALLFSKLSSSNEISRSRYPFQSYEGTLQSSLAKYLQFVLEAERIPVLADPDRLSSISLLLSQMKFNQLHHILDVFHKSSSEHWNTSPCYSDMMRDICKYMVSTMKNVKPIREAVSKIVRLFFDFLDKSSSQSLLMEVCGFQAAGGWSHNIKYEFFSDIISSTEVWDKPDSVAKLDILNTCARLIESWITEESNTLGENSWNNQTLNDLRNVQFSSCAHFFFLIEEHRFDPKQKYVAGSFQPYLKKLPCLLLRSFMLKLHTSIVTTKPCVKDFPLCLELFIMVCRHFVAKNFLSDKLSKEECDNIVNCLFFIDDPRSWERFADEICSKAMITDDNQPFQQTLLNTNFQEAIAKSPLASAAIIRIADYWVSNWKSVAEPPNTWSMPKVVINNYSEVQKFLHSSESHFIYHLRSIEHFRRFKNNLKQTDLLMKCVSVSDWNPRDRNCRLDKTTEYHKRFILELFQRLTSEMDDVLKFRQSLSQNLATVKSTGKRKLELGSSSTSSDEVPIVSSKRSKP